MLRPFNYWWRLFATGFSLSAFGIGSLLITFCLFPPIHLLSSSRRRANLGCQYVVHLSFRFFIWMVKTLGLLTYEIVGAEKLTRGYGNLVIANHPTLLDVVFIVSLMPRTLCVVKKAAWSNPFLAGVMWATGYIQNDDPMELIAECVQSIERDDNLVIFPEATRTAPGQPMKLKRGAASVIVQSQRLYIPLIITCRPRMLSKGEKWWKIPNSKAHYRISVGDKINPEPLLVKGGRLAESNRRVNEAIKELFILGIERHERSG